MIECGGKVYKGRMASYELIRLGYCLDSSMCSKIQELEDKSGYAVKH